MAAAARESVPSTHEERVFVTSQWRLVWWRFKRHRIALPALAVIVCLYLVTVFAETLAIQDPHDQLSRRAFIPPQMIRLWDGWDIGPFVYAIDTQRNPYTLKMEHVEDRTKKYPIAFFVRDPQHEYKLLRLFTTDIHVMGARKEDGSPADLHPLGTDRFGRDMWSRLMYGTRISMSIGLVGVSMSLFLGVLLGGISGYRSGLSDLVIQRLIEFLRSMPTIPLWLSLAAAIPADWSNIRVYFAITIILSIIGWTGLAREVRGRFLVMREEDFVVAARLYGSSELRVIFHHMVPSFLSHLIASTTLAIPAMIIAETSLSFLNLGLRPPTISWGVLLFEAQNIYSVAAAPWLLMPALLVIVVVLSFNFMGDGLRDAADPYSVAR